MTGNSRGMVGGGRIQSHRDLIVWQKAMDLAEAVYSLVDAYPDREKFGLVSQMTRSAVSVPANIAEGHARSSRRDYANFLAIAKGSLMETETYLLLSVRLHFVSEESVKPLLDLIIEISKMLTSLRNRLL